MGGGTQGGADDEIITAINVTPLVDVVLVLLIILMVTASYIVSRAIPMDLPSAQGEGAPPRTLAVSIDSKGDLFVDAQPVNEEQLVEAVRRYAAQVPEADRRATIAADARVTHGRVVRVIDLLRKNRVTRFAINVRPEDLR
ncbi:MAG: biopolymer transporter ExbD [Deltaproteobacteria bacterium]|nr:biopolymer transporter ExbD [Sandaracinaceae bacterium]MCX7808519.1 biopolymer transporter ExbD [Deltaproteobacteria bacterium]MDW8246522.1 biopolymer transporter ExbD [Sandaracinaceae bacterium]